MSKGTTQEKLHQAQCLAKRAQYLAKWGMILGTISLSLGIVGLLLSLLSCTSSPKHHNYAKNPTKQGILAAFGQPKPKFHRIWVDGTETMRYDTKSCAWIYKFPQQTQSKFCRKEENK